MFTHVGGGVGETSQSFTPLGLLWLPHSCQVGKERAEGGVQKALRHRPAWPARQHQRPPLVLVGGGVAVCVSTAGTNPAYHFSAVRKSKGLSCLALLQYLRSYMMRRPAVIWAYDLRGCEVDGS
ncbi:hypothetical protein E2C01_072333 [Portunus trituberculatus]|uniref:Uncharacterized protein n=1 Tax=Portunus trituberculatus TaxID=210409 RepID=A0A5B7IAX0_PORTR|nr:hypothetical protein [Portunus trituberculatus]